jgi:hypothetical protein
LNIFDQNNHSSIGRIIFQKNWNFFDQINQDYLNKFEEKSFIVQNHQRGSKEDFLLLKLREERGDLKLRPIGCNIILISNRERTFGRATINLFMNYNVTPQVSSLHKQLENDALREMHQNDIYLLSQGRWRKA